MDDQVNEGRTAGRQRGDRFSRYLQLTELGPGTYTVTEQTQTGWTQTYGNSGYTVTASSGTNVPNNNFGNFQNITISGMKFNDLNGDRAPG